MLFQDVDIDETGGLYGSRHFEQAVLADLERAYQRLEAFLGLRPPRKIDVVIYDPAIFDRTFAGLFRFAAAGFYHGVIRVRGDREFHMGLSNVLHHELVHAALDAAAPSFVYPAWFNEGVADWFGERALGRRGFSPREYRMLTGAWQAGAVRSLAALSTPSFAHLGPGPARVAYLQSYGMIDFLVRQHGERDLKRFCEEVVRKRDLDRAARRVYRSDLSTLEARFFDELRSS